MRLPDTPVVALLGDLIRSREAVDRRALHQALVSALAEADRARPALAAPAVVVGDEFQGVYATVGAALEATHRIRLALAGIGEVRFGLGRGEVFPLDEGGLLQDGSAWWAARDAIMAVEEAAQHASRAALRTGLVAAEPATFRPAVRAATAAIDLALARLDATSQRILLGIVGGRRQSEIAGELGLTPQAVNQRVLRHGLGVLADAMRQLWEEP
nr:RNA polymerase subunit sigma-70 [Propionibacterium sp.]